MVTTKDIAIIWDILAPNNNRLLLHVGPGRIGEEALLGVLRDIGI